ncbi:MAG: CDP-alcohol phosphatidyltransferase family protein [Chloroflexota bacterium]
MTGSLVSPEARARVRGLITPIAVALGRLGLTPNALTLVGFGVACVAAAAAAAQAWLLAGLLVVFGGVFDLFDGALARATNRVSSLGAFMDSVFDRWGEGVVYVGVVVGCLAADFALGAFLAAAAMASAFMVSYTRAKAESLGFTAGTGMANVGLAPREVRIAILTVGLVLTGIQGTANPLLVYESYTLPGGIDVVLPWAGEVWLSWSLAAIAVLAAVTTIQRIVHTINQASKQEQG